MLVLSRKKDEQICIGNDIVVTIVKVEHDRVRIGITAPPTMPVFRKELITQAREAASRPGCAHDIPPQ